MAVPGDWGWSGDAAELEWNYPLDPARYNYSIAYAKARQLGVPHELAVQSAQRQVYGKVRSKNPEPENERNRNFGVKPLYSVLPALQAQAQAVQEQQQVQAEVVQELEQAPTPESSGGRRMAMRYGLPLLGALAAGYGIAALSQPRAEVEQEEYAGVDQ